MGESADRGGSRPTPLRHPVRRRIYEHLLQLPGDYLRSIARTMDLEVGEARHHLDVLVRAGLLTEARVDRRRRYFPRGDLATAERSRLFDQFWRYRDIRGLVLHTVRRLGPTGPAAVARALGISRQLAAYHLRHLEGQGQVRRSGEAYVAP